MVVCNAPHHGLGDSSMLERIDALFSCGAGDHINIPQIVVVGDQSSGKSSVLSGLIRKDFPRDSGLCTRFATKIVFRRAETAAIRVSVIPSEGADQAHRAHIADWGELQVDSFDDFPLSNIIQEVQKVIGVAGSEETISFKPTFSGDVLQLEISGPNEEHLSVIDVPGIFRDATPGLTTKDDIEFVRNMVLRYMENPRSVMLTVIPANVDVATQEILKLAEDLDPEGDRTLGVLTKPDLVDAGAEDGIVKLIEGRARKIKLGWHVVRNPGQRDLSDPTFHRQRQELDFFQDVRPWNELDTEYVGIEALRGRLRDVLSGLVRREFSNVRLEIRKQLNHAETKLKGLGPERNDRTAQAAYLTEIAVDFQRLVDLALSAKFGTNRLFDGREELKIAPAVVLRMEQFREDMEHFGHDYIFNLPRNRQDGPLLIETSIRTKKHKRAIEVPPPEFFASSIPEKTELRVRRWTESTGLEDLLFAPTKLLRSASEQSDEWLRALHSSSRGFELGTFDPVILASAMRKQTTNWRSISSGFISDVAVIIHTFARTALHCLCLTERLQTELYNTLFDDMKVRYLKAIEQVDFILKVELENTPMTQNQSFIDRLEENRRARFIASLEELAIKNEHNESVVKLTELTGKHPMSNDQYLAREIHDILQSYYEVALQRFIDNVCKQASDYFLVTGPDTPLKVFSPVFVSRMTDEQLERVAKEEPQAQKLRAKLIKEIESLKRATQVLA